MTLQQIATGNSFTGSVYRDGFGILNYKLATNAALDVNVPVAAYTTGDHDVDYNVTQLGGVMRLGAGDGAEIMFIVGAGGAAPSSPTFLVSAFYPWAGQDGNIAGYIEIPLVDAGAAFSASSLAVGTVLGAAATAMRNVDLSAATNPIVSTALWGKALVVAVNSVSLSGVVFANNTDFVQVAGDYPARLRVTPLEGATHLRCQLKSGGGASATMWAVARRTRGGSMRG